MHKQNYTAKILLNEEKISSGTISAHFPNVSGITIHLTYFQNFISNPVFMVRTINMYPESYAYFKVPCIVESCVEGGFDMANVISKMAKTRKKSEKGEMECAGSGKSGHARISYEIEMKFLEKTKPARS